MIMIVMFISAGVSSEKASSNVVDTNNETSLQRRDHSEEKEGS